MTPPHPPRTAQEQAKLEAHFVELFEHMIGFNELIGMTVESFSPCRFKLAMKPGLIGLAHHGRLHGGVLATLLDNIGGAAIFVELTQRHAHEGVDQLIHRQTRMGTIDMRIDYLRPGLGRHFVASADVVRLGGRIATTQMRVVNDADELIATGTGTYIVS